MDGNLVNVIEDKVADAVGRTQGNLLNNMETLITSKLDSFQSLMVIRQKQMTDSQLTKMQEMSVDKYVFKKKGNEEQYKHNQKVTIHVSGDRFRFRGSHG